MALNISDHADVYHVLFHTDDAKITNSCQITTDSDSTFVKPSYRKSTDDNLALKTKLASINMNCFPKSDFFFSMKFEFDCEMKDIYSEVPVTAKFSAISNSADFIDISIDTELGKSTTLSISRKDNKVSVFKDGTKVNLPTNSFSGILSAIELDSTAKCLGLKTIVDDIILIDNESVVSDSYTIESNKSEIANNAVAVDTSNNTYGTVAKA